MMVRDVHTKLKDKEIVESKEAFCPEDPNKVGFRIQVTFARESASPDGMSVFLSAPGKAVTQHSLAVGVYDSDGSLLQRFTSYDSDPLRLPCGYPKLLTIDDKSTATMKIVVECQYTVEPDKSQPNEVGLCAKLQSDLMHAFHSNTASDITFSVRGVEIKAHKLILVARSDYFSTMFDCDMQESMSNKVEVTDIPADVFKALLGFLYGIMPEGNKCDVWMELLEAADKYNI